MSPARFSDRNEGFTWIVAGALEAADIDHSEMATEAKVVPPHRRSNVRKAKLWPYDELHHALASAQHFKSSEYDDPVRALCWFHWVPVEAYLASR